MEKLQVKFRDRAPTKAVRYVDDVLAVYVNDDKLLGRRMSGTKTSFTGFMAELYTKTHLLKRRRLEAFSVPFLEAE